MLTMAPASLGQTFLIGSAGAVVAASTAALASQASGTLVTSQVSLPALQPSFKLDLTVLAIHPPKYSGARE